MCGKVTIFVVSALTAAIFFTIGILFQLNMIVIKPAYCKRG